MARVNSRGNRGRPNKLIDMLTLDQAVKALKPHRSLKSLYRALTKNEAGRVRWRDLDEKYKMVFAIQVLDSIVSYDERYASSQALAIIFRNLMEDRDFSAAWIKRWDSKGS